MTRFAVFFLGCLLMGAGSSAHANDVLTAHAERFSKMYFAPMDGALFSRMVSPSLGVVEFERKNGGELLTGPSGWKARKKGRSATVYAPVEKGGAALEYHFIDGLPHTLKVDGRAVRVQVEKGAVSYSGAIPPLWKEDLSQDPTGRKWQGRFSLFYRNPNRTAALMTSLALVFLWLMLFPPASSRVLALVSGCVFGAIFVHLLLITGSRGGLLAFLSGASVLTVVRLFRLRGRMRIWLSVCAGVVVLLAIAAAVGGGWVSEWAADKGNALRIDIFRTFPRMMVDAPDGWSVSRPGFAFVEWYQNISSPNVTWTLVSAHLTALAAMGWIGGFFWLSGWFAVIAILFRYAFRGHPLPCALWTSFFAAALFNPILSSWSLWIVPVISLVLFARDCRGGRLRRYWPDALCCCIFSALILFAVWVYGRSVPAPGGVDVREEGDRVLVAGNSPAIWVVDDRETLGWAMAPKEIRFFYQNVAGAPSLGYVKSLADVPKKVGRLVLAGGHARAYLEAWSKGTAPVAREVYFISPPFGPSAVPESLHRVSSVAMIIGEFALRYVDVYGSSTLPEWVTVVPGAECYIPGWVGLIVSR